MTEVNDYLEALGAPQELFARITAFLSSYESLLPEDVSDYFISEYLDADQQRTFESLWLFSDHFVMEATLLGRDEDQFDFVPLKKNVHHIIAQKRAFDLEEASASSQMVVEVWFTEQRYGRLRASGENCLKLAAVLKERFIPNALLQPR